MLTDFWQLAQDHWAHDRLMPIEEFTSHGFTPILEVHLAVEKPGGIYAKGGEERFAWLRDRVGGGKKSAESRKKKYGTAQPNPRTEPELSSASVGTAPELARTAPEPLTTSTSIYLIPTEENKTNLVPGNGSPTATQPKVALKKRQPNPIAREMALKARAPAAANQLIGVLREHGGDETAAMESLPPWIWNFVISRWRKWEAFCIEAQKEFSSGKQSFFQSDLTRSLTAALLLATDNQNTQGA